MRWSVPRSMSSAAAAAAFVGLAGVILHSACNVEAKPVQPDGNMARSQIPALYKWDLGALFNGDGAFETGLTTAARDRAKLATFRQTLSDPAHLRACLELYFATRLLTNELTLYSSMRGDTDQANTELQGMHDRALDAMNELIAAAGFIRREVLALDDAAMQTAYTAQPKLTGYKPYLDQLRRRRARVLGDEAERILALAGDNLWAEIDLNEIPSDHEKTFSSLLTDIPLPMIKDDNGADVQLTLSNYGKFRRSKSREVRRGVVEKFFATLKQYRHALAGTFAGQVNFNVFLARARGYDTALAAYLDKDDIDPAVYTNLIATIRANIEPLHDYVRLRKKVMHLDDLHIYDLYTPMVGGVDMKFTFDEATKVLPEALAPLGSEYLAALRHGLDPNNGWIDVYPHKGKQSGAFSSSVYGVHPYVETNYFNGYDDLSTLAHEFGHAIHSYLSMSKQPYVTFNYAPFNAEIASTTNEKLLADYMLAKAKSDDQRLALLNSIVESIRTTIYRQTLFAEFELRAHTAAEKGTPLTADFLDTTYKDLVAYYYGKDFTIGDNDDIEWAYVPHFYYKFYMMSYATGLSAGIALASKVETGEAGARRAYLGMLEGGSSKPPLALLKDAGVDLTKPEAIVGATRLMAESLAKMRALLETRPTNP